MDNENSAFRAFIMVLFVISACMFVLGLVLTFMALVAMDETLKDIVVFTFMSFLIARLSYKYVINSR